MEKHKTSADSGAPQDNNVQSLKDHEQTHTWSEDLEDLTQYPLFFGPMTRKASPLLATFTIVGLWEIEGAEFLRERRSC